MTERASASRGRASVFALLLILALGLSLRLIDIRAPLLDRQTQRQVDTATMARALYEDKFDPLHPQVNWGGNHGDVESEFPVLPIITAWLYDVFGETETIGRLVAVGFSLLGIWALYDLVAGLAGVAHARAAAFFLAVSPGAVYYGRTFMPDAPMLGLAVTGVALFVRYFRTDKTAYLWAGAAVTTLAWLAKLPALITLAPIAAAGWHVRRRLIVRDVRALAALGVAVAVAAAWYWHAWNIFGQTGLTVGLHPPKSYPAFIAPGPWADHESKWSTFSLLGDRHFYGTIADSLISLHFTPAGLALAAVGVLLWRGTGRLVADAWLVGITALTFATAEVSRWHDYYQLLFVPAAAMYFGAVAAPMFDSAWIRARVPLGRLAIPAAAATLAGLSLVAFVWSGVLDSHFPPRPAAIDVAAAGTAIGHAVPQGGLLVAIDSYGVNSPVLLYYAHRKGWSFDEATLTPAVLERLRQLGARYFVTSEWSAVTDGNKDLAAYLQTRRPLKIAGTRDAAAFDLAGP